MRSRILDDMTNFIFVEDEPQKADIIFIPGDSYPELPEYAASLYHNGFSQLLLPSGGLSIKIDTWPGPKSKADIYNRQYKTDCDFYVDVLLKNGVPESAVIGEDKSRYTKENAYFSRRITEEHGIEIKDAIIVCKSFHARRCLMMYQLAFPQANLMVVPVDCQGITRENWFMSENGIERVFGEVARCGNQCVEDTKMICKNAVKK